jgi:hypothetical protein
VFLGKFVMLAMKDGDLLAEGSLAPGKDWDHVGMAIQGSGGGSDCLRLRLDLFVDLKSWRSVLLG